MHKLSGNTEERVDEADSARLVFMEAIARRLTVVAHYNGTRMTLAPHVLFARHGELYVGACNLEKNWRSEEERRLGSFKLDGLRDVKLTADTFEPLSTPGSVSSRSEDEILLTVE